MNPLQRLAPLGLAVLAASTLALQCPSSSPDRFEIPGLEAEVRVVVDRLGTPHVFGESDLDVARVQGWLHARDRFFQMDLTRRQVDGTQAELLGEGSLGGDIQARTVGLHRAAQRSLDALPARTRAVIDAYTEGVNAWVDAAEAGGFLPPEYAELELTRVDRWQAVDVAKVGKGLAASLSLDIDAGNLETLEDYIETGAAAAPPFDGEAMYFEDIFRSAPMDPASMVPDATGSVPYLTAGATAPGASARQLAGAPAPIDPRRTARVRSRVERSTLHAQLEDRSEHFVGSNEWGVDASRSATGFPLYANDPHLSLNVPATFYEVHLNVENDPVEGPLNVSGVSIPGAPLVVQGQNPHITWGSTTNPMDVTDLFDDRVVVSDDPACAPTRLCIESEGELHRLDAEFADYFVNDPDDGVLDNVRMASADQVPLTSRLILTVPFRSFGPVVDIDDAGVVLEGLFGQPAGGTTQALVLQYVGFHATQEIQTFAVWARAENLDDFVVGLKEFDFGSQNWGYADVDGNVAIYTSGELPLRRDLEAGGDPACRSPFFARDGSGPCNWVADPARSQGQTIPFAVLPFEEMPQVVNPANGFVVNANNDPAGTSLDNDPLNQFRPSKPSAIYFLNQDYSIGDRAGRITRLLRDALASGEALDADDMKRFQANVQPLDAELMRPFLVQAFDNAARAGAPAELAALAADAGVAEAVERIRDWDLDSPTGIPEGYDRGDTDGIRTDYVSSREARSSVAMTLYSVWRAKAVKAVIDQPLRDLGLRNPGSSRMLADLHHLLDQDPFSGVGASGFDFFPEPAGLASAADRRDHTLLSALRSALDALASSDFQDAFGGSTSQDDYRWGRLHRITFDHATNPAYSIPPAAGYQDLGPDLPGVARDGGFGVVNASSHSALADEDDEFRFGGGPNRRYVGVGGASATPGSGIAGEQILPGGPSGVPGSPEYATQLGRWLTADYDAVDMSEVEARRGATGELLLAPPSTP
ncbi:MAG: penicillin acylase family protein [Myxococcota bacterium]